MEREMHLTQSERDRIQQAVMQAKSAGAVRATSWYLLTGAPGSGKTTLLEEIRSRGHSVVEDPARAIVTSDIAMGVAPDEVRKDYEWFQRRVLQRALSTMERLSSHDPIFFDYGLAESLAFLKARGLDWSTDVLAASAKIQFARVFLLRPLKPVQLIESDPIRVESNTLRLTLHTLIGDVYGAIGQTPTEIPVLPVAGRADAVLQEASLKS
jgi:predicted ATPase